VEINDARRASPFVLASLDKFPGGDRRPRVGIGKCKERTQGEETRSLIAVCLHVTSALDSAYNARFGVVRLQSGSSRGKSRSFARSDSETNAASLVLAHAATASPDIDLPSVKRRFELLARGASRGITVSRITPLRERGGSGQTSPVGGKSIRSLPRVWCHRVYIKPRSSAYARTRVSDASSSSMAGRLGVCHRGVVFLPRRLFLPPAVEYSIFSGGRADAARLCSK